LRPRVAYAVGLIYWWARIASLAPSVANFVTHAPSVSSLVKRAGGVAPQRELPAFAPQTFVRWYSTRAAPDQGRPPVLVWPDTFTNYFHPDVGKATIEVLEAAGYRVLVPEVSLCCGRPLYDHGMLRTAGRLLRRILDVLRPQIRAGIPVVGMEPSCVAVFRDELPNLFPNDQDAKRLSGQSYMLSEFLQREGWRPPALHRKALVQGHCHHKAVMGFEAERRVLEEMELDCEIPDAGCCGLAGSFGFEAGEKYEVSMRVGERVLFPKVREASGETLIVADGFSCRTQIEQGAGRHAIHLAQVIQLALRSERRASR
jgi:Fe-S oxidoreductase